MTGKESKDIMLQAGIKNTKVEMVEYSNTALGTGSGGLPVYSTPRMVALMESTCYESVLPELEEGKGTVGPHLDIVHMAAVPVGLQVTCQSELVEVDGRKLVFHVEVTDGISVVGEGRHERFIIDNERFMEKADQRRVAVTDMGNPSRPQGDAGRQMLKRMNRSHYDMTGWALGQLTFHDGERILDVGCGGGRTLNRLAEQYPASTFDGVDYSDVSVEVAKEINEVFIRQGRMTIREASVDELPFGDDTFHKVVTVESFYFWPDPEHGLQEICRVLRPGGRFLLVAEVYGDAELSEKEKESIRKYTLRNPTREEYRQYLLRCGFENVEIHTEEGKNWICVCGEKSS